MSSASPVTHTSAGKKPRKPHRYRPGTVALREIRRQQKNTDRLLPALAVERLVRELSGEVTEGRDPMRFSKDALLALQEGAESRGRDLPAGAKTGDPPKRQTVSLRTSSSLTCPI